MLAMRVGLTACLALALLCALLAADETKPPASRPPAKQPPEQQRPEKPLNVNSASTEDLVKLPGIGPATAKLIVEHREKHGPFRRVEELLIIRGISRSKLRRLRPHITIDGKGGDRGSGPKKN